MRLLKKNFSICVGVFYLLATQGCGAPKVGDVAQFHDEPKSLLTGIAKDDLQSVSGLWSRSLSSAEVNYSYREDFGLNTNYMNYLGAVVINLLSPDPYVCLPIQEDLERLPVVLPASVSLKSNTLILDFKGNLSGMRMILKPRQRLGMREEVEISWVIPKGWVDTYTYDYTGTFYKFSK